MFTGSNTKHISPGKTSNKINGIERVCRQSGGVGVGGHVLDIQLFMVLAHSSSFGSEGVEHHSWVDEILLHTLKPSIQLFEPHQLSSI